MAALGLCASARAGTQPQLVKSQAEPSPATAQRRFFFFFLTKAGVGAARAGGGSGPSPLHRGTPHPRPAAPPSRRLFPGGRRGSLSPFPSGLCRSVTFSERAVATAPKLFPSSPRKPPSLCSSSCHVSLPDVLTVLRRFFFLVSPMSTRAC